MSVRMGYPGISAAVFLLVLLIGSPPTSADSEKESAMEEIQSLMQQEDWKKAIKAIKTYHRKHAKTDEEKDEISDLLTTVEGRQDLDEIETYYRKRQKIRKPVRDLNKFIGEFAEFPELVERAKGLLQALRSQFVHVLEDFEVWDEDDPTRAGGKMTPVEDAKLVKHGKKSARWKTGPGWSSYAIDCTGLDWGEYAYFCAWIFNEKKPSRPSYIRFDPTSGGDHYWAYRLVVDWVGWKEIRMPLSGRGSLFSKHGNPHWDSIDYLQILHDDDAGGRVDVILDDIRLEKAVK
ncbi:MAG: hypothetical protein O6952_00690 [Planctomycetota bacterium]|nr:hypothetical protein [Planctomycetota bacterium]